MTLGTIYNEARIISALTNYGCSLPYLGFKNENFLLTAKAPKIISKSMLLVFAFCGLFLNHISWIAFDLEKSLHSPSSRHDPIINIMPIIVLPLCIFSAIAEAATLADVLQNNPIYLSLRKAVDNSNAIKLSIIVPVLFGALYGLFQTIVKLILCRVACTQ